MNSGGQPQPWKRVAPFAFASLVCFLLAMVLVFLMIWKAETLARWGLTGKMFFAVSISLGLAVSGFLFGVLQSYATYTGHQVGGKLKLGGPVVGFMLVMLLARGQGDSLPFDETVYVHGSKGSQDIVLRDSGEVLMDLGGDRRPSEIRHNGEAYFPGIPFNFRGQTVNLSVASDKFESVDSQEQKKLDGSSIYLEVKRKSGRVYGNVENQDGGCPTGKTIRLAGQTIPVDATGGNFDITVPGDLMDADLILEAAAPGCALWSFHVVPDSTRIDIVLQKPSKSSER